MKRIFAILVCIMLSLCVLTSCGFSNTYVIATDDQMQPFCYIDGQGNPMGFDIDIINAIAEKQGLEIELRPLGLIDGMDALSLGKVDGLMAALIPTDELSAKYTFSDMYFNNEFAFAVKKGSNKRLIKAFNEGLAKLIESGEYDEIYKRHFGEGDKYFG